MGKRLGIPDLDLLFHTSPVGKIVLNDLPSETEEERKAIDSLIMTTYNHQDFLSSVPTCECGELSMGFNLGRYCTSCHTKVTRPVESDIGQTVWFRTFDGVDGFIQPNVWLMLSSVLSPGGYNLMDWITNPSSRVPDNVSQTTQKRIQVLEASGWVRGLNSFIRNIDQFIDILPALKITDPEAYQKFLRKNKHVIFPKHLPMPTKALIVLENNSLGSFADLSITGAVDAARTIIDTSRKAGMKNIPYLEKKMVSVIANLANFNFVTYRDTFSSKRGWFRGQVFSSRSHFCFRGVITSISAPHHYEELHIPWSIGLECLKYHILTKLRQRGYMARDAWDLVEGSGKVYVPILDEIMKEIIAEFPSRGIPTIFQRNPSLTRLSGQLLFVTEVKSNVDDQTISMSVLVLKGPN